MTTQVAGLNTACLCGKSDARPVFETVVAELGKTFHVVECEACGLKRTVPFPTAEDMTKLYGAEYGAWRGAFVPVLRAIRRGIAGQKVRMLTRTVSVGRGRLLDVGCGQGWDALAFQRAGWVVTGFDFSERSIQRALENGIPAVAAPSLSQAKLPAASFEAAVMWQVLEHLPDPRETLREIHRLLKPSGPLLLSVPNAESPIAHWLKGDSRGYDVGRHLWHFSKSTLATFLQEEGWELLRWHPMTYEPDGPGVIQALYDGVGLRRSFYDHLAGQQWKGKGALSALATATCAPLLVPAGLVWGVAKAYIGHGETLTVACRHR